MSEQDEMTAGRCEDCKQMPIAVCFSSQDAAGNVIGGRKVCNDCAKAYWPEPLDLEAEVHRLTEHNRLLVEVLDEAIDTLEWYGAEDEWDGERFLGDSGGDDPQFVGPNAAASAFKKAQAALAAIEGGEK